MKRLLFILIFCLPLMLYAQHHLEFLGHPITGNLKEFVKQLEADNFMPVSKKYRFKGMRTRTLKGKFWEFPECHIVVIQPSKMENVTSVLIRPLSGYVLLEDMIEAYDNKYNNHMTNYPKTDVNAVIYTWNVQKGCIQIHASTVYGQAFSIIYRDNTEVTMLNNLIDKVDSDL